MPDAPMPLDLEGLTALSSKGLGRAQVRLRESTLTLSGWRMETTCAQGEGTILLVDLPQARVVYRGEGTHLGWPQAKLVAVWQALSAPPGGDEPFPFELPQLG